MYRHISKGAWAFSDKDHGWQVSDCTAESLKVSIFFFGVQQVEYRTSSNWLFLTKFSFIPVLPTFRYDAAGNCWTKDGT